MKKRYYILILRQIGMIGANEIVRINEQPKDGFATFLDAENHLEKMMESGDYPCSFPRHYFMIHELYSKPKEK